MLSALRMLLMIAVLLALLAVVLPVAVVGHATSAWSG